MKQHERNAVELIQRIVEPWGIRTRVHRGGKHLAVICKLRDGSEHKFPVSGSPRDADCQLNQCRQQVTAWLERTGHSTGRGSTRHREPKRRRQPRYRSTIHRIEVAIDPDTGPARDPWAALSGFRVNG